MIINALSSSISSSSTSPLSPGAPPRNGLSVSGGRLKLVLRLDCPLPDLPETDGFPVLENEVRREPCSLGSGVVPREANLPSVGDAE